MGISFEFFLDRRRLKKKSGKYPVKLRIEKPGEDDRDRAEFQTIFELSDVEWEKLKAPRISPELAQIRDLLKSLTREMAPYLMHADTFRMWDFYNSFIVKSPAFAKRSRKFKDAPVLADDSDFDYGPYIKSLPIIAEKHTDVLRMGTTFKAIILQNVREGRIGNALRYQQSYNTLFIYGGNPKFSQIDVVWLRSYENTLVKAGKSKTYVGITVRSLRAVFNEAAERQYINKVSTYPFGRRRYMPPTSVKKKIAIREETLLTILKAEDLPEYMDRARALWFFCYWGNGMNIKDLCYLKQGQVEGNFLRFERQKTILTGRHDPKLITVYLIPEMHEIINKYGNERKGSHEYLFDLGMDHKNPIEIAKNICRVSGFINANMKRLLAFLGIDEKINNASSRHSFAWHMKKAGVPTEEIQEALGHHAITTTEIYTGSFEDNAVKERSVHLVRKGNES